MAEVPLSMGGMKVRGIALIMDKDVSAVEYHDSHLVRFLFKGGGRPVGQGISKRNLFAYLRRLLFKETISVGQRFQLRGTDGGIYVQGEFGSRRGYTGNPDYSQP